MQNYSLLYAQSGGPTSVINSSACGVITEALNRGIKVYAGINGIDGILKGNVCDVTKEDLSEIEKLKFTPASCFGSCRKKLPHFSQDDTLYKKLVEIFKKLNVKYFIYNGGNDSMNTCAKVAQYLKFIGYDGYVIGVPKTIDNDLMNTDHCPGYGSAAKYIATSCREIALDTAVYEHGRVTVVEVMGRDAGWLTASSALASVNGMGPDLIYLPERPFDLESFCTKCKEVYDKKKTCLVAVSEGIRDKDGIYICSYANSTSKDAFNNVQLGGVGSFLAQTITEKTGIKTRAVELSLMQRCSAHIISKTDSFEAFMAGKHAVELATSGVSGKMVAFKRTSSSPYAIEYVGVDLDGVAHGTQSMPDSFISDNACWVTQEFIDYAMPLIKGEITIPYVNGIPSYANLKKERVEF